MSNNTNNNDNDEITIQDVLEAEKRIRPFIHKTPLLQKSALSKMSGYPKGLFFKCESLQRTGSFKIRGSTNAVLKHLEKIRKENKASNSNNSSSSTTQTTTTTFVSHSSGNHAQALARAARIQNQKCHIVVPRTAPGAKVAAMKENGAEVTFCEPVLKSREAGVKNLIENVYGKDKSVFIHPYSHPHVIEGQASCGLEIAEQFPIELMKLNSQDPFLLTNDTSSRTPVFICPVGGGGLLSGTSIALRYKFPNALIIAAEPVEADDASRSFVSGKVEPLRQLPPPTMADGLMTTVSERTLKIIRKNVDAIITVTEEEIARATKEIFQRLKIVIEPSAGVPAAVALYKRQEIQRKFPDRKNLDAAVCILCGGNVDLVKLGKIVSKL